MTGMMLNMDNSEILRILDDPTAWAKTLQECRHLLGVQEHQPPEEGNESFTQSFEQSLTRQKKFDDLTKGNVTGGTARRPITPLGKQVARTAQPIPAHEAPPPATAQPVATEQPHTTIDVDAETATSIAQAALEEVSVKEIDEDIIWCAFSEMQTARGMTSSSKIMAEGAKLQASQGKQKRPQGR